MVPCDSIITELTSDDCVVSIVLGAFVAIIVVAGFVVRASVELLWKAVVRVVAGACVGFGLLLVVMVDVGIFVTFVDPAGTVVVIVSSCSIRCSKLVGGTLIISAVGLGLGRGLFVVSTYVTVTNGCSVVVFGSFEANDIVCCSVEGLNVAVLCVLFVLAFMVTVVSGRFVGVMTVVILVVGVNCEIVVFLVLVGFVVVTLRVGFGREAVVGRRVTVLISGAVVVFRVDVDVGRCVAAGFGLEVINGLFVVASVAGGSLSGSVMSVVNVVGRCRFVGLVVAWVVGRRVDFFVVVGVLVVVIGCSS